MGLKVKKLGTSKLGHFQSVLIRKKECSFIGKSANLPSICSIFVVVNCIQSSMKKIEHQIVLSIFFFFKSDL